MAILPSLKKPKPSAPLYWAYGSNLSVDQMRYRCPDAVQAEKLILPEGRLVFRFHADVQIHKGSMIAGGLWRISAADEAALDRYEGYNPHSPYAGTYNKHYLELQRSNGKIIKALYYKRNINKGIMPPAEGYRDIVAQGYRDFDLPMEWLELALAHSWANKNKTPEMRRRYRMNGKITLARGLGDEIKEAAE